MLYRQRRMTVSGSNTYGLSQYKVEERFLKEDLTNSEWEPIANMVNESTGLKLINQINSEFSDNYFPEQPPFGS